MWRPKKKPFCNCMAGYLKYFIVFVLNIARALTCLFLLAGNLLCFYNFKIELLGMGGKCIGPRDHWSQKIFGVARKYFKFQKQTRVYWPDINVNFVWAENILSLRMTKTDALINWTPPPPPHTHPGEMWGIYGE